MEEESSAKFTATGCTIQLGENFGEMVTVARPLDQTSSGPCYIQATVIKLRLKLWP